MEQDEAFTDLHIEEDCHLCTDGFDVYRIQAGKESDDLYTPGFALRLMEYLLDGFAVMTSTQDLPIDPLVIKEMAQYRAVPQRFVPACKKHGRELKIVHT